MMLKSIAKKLILTILNGGFSKIYHDDININKFLKNIEIESKMLHDYFFKIEKRIDDEKIFNYKGKNFSRIEMYLLKSSSKLCYSRVNWLFSVVATLICFIDVKQSCMINPAVRKINLSHFKDSASHRKFA